MLTSLAHVFGFFLRCLHGKMDRFAAAERNILLLESWSCHINFDRLQTHDFKKNTNATTFQQLCKFQNQDLRTPYQPDTLVFPYIYIYHVSLPWGVFLAFHPLFLLPPTLLVSHRGRSSQYDLSKRQNFSFWGLKLDFRNGRGGLFLGISRFPRKKNLPRNLRAELPPWIFFVLGGEKSQQKGV